VSYHRFTKLRMIGARCGNCKNFNAKESLCERIINPANKQKDFVIAGPTVESELCIWWEDDGSLSGSQSPSTRSNV
jgi:hypothetical protein